MGSSSMSEGGKLNGAGSMFRMRGKAQWSRLNVRREQAQ